jgi:hypothetical protein
LIKLFSKQLEPVAKLF